MGHTVILHMLGVSLPLLLKDESWQDLLKEQVSILLTFIATDAESWLHIYL